MSNMLSAQRAQMRFRIAGSGSDIHSWASKMVLLFIDKNNIIFGFVNISSVAIAAVFIHLIYLPVGR